MAVDTLPSVLVQPRNYRQDSLANLEEYRDVFNFSPRYFTNMKKWNWRAGMGVGINMDMFFDAKHNRQMLKLQEARRRGKGNLCRSPLYPRPGKKGHRS